MKNENVIRTAAELTRGDQFTSLATVEAEIRRLTAELLELGAIKIDMETCELSMNLEIIRQSKSVEELVLELYMLLHELGHYRYSSIKF